MRLAVLLLLAPAFPVFAAATAPPAPPLVIGEVEVFGILSLILITLSVHLLNLAQLRYLTRRMEELAASSPAPGGDDDAGTGGRRAGECALRLALVSLNELAGSLAALRAEVQRADLGAERDRRPRVSPEAEPPPAGDEEEEEEATQVVEVRPLRLPALAPEGSPPEAPAPATRGRGL